jgi:hypothetical protein
MKYLVGGTYAEFVQICEVLGVSPNDRRSVKHLNSHRSVEGWRFQEGDQLLFGHRDRSPNFVDTLEAIMHSLLRSRLAMAGNGTLIKIGDK